MFKFLFRVVKAIVVWSIILVVIGVGLMFVIANTPQEDTQPVNAVSVVENVELEEVSNELPEIFKTCFYSKSNKNTSNTDSLMISDGTYGTYDDGDIWVGYTRKVAGKTYEGQVALCNKNGVAY